MDLLTKRLFIEGLPRVERGDDLAGGHNHFGDECDVHVHGDDEDLEDGDVDVIQGAGSC